MVGREAVSSLAISQMWGRTSPECLGLKHREEANRPLLGPPLCVF